uniref:8-oxo-dGTP pyrophosphatase MutT, NUDIX family n=1 Tax=Candidatus Kentrum sp. SD TaxID=2126332 RepID=A0A450Y5X6_9GAMM|nr:MAG: 8-oxo-dGTP pyrophosphatase MutT, NUDIX family [Candidatus Kentron sp. SD]VFK40586.1 MAG: 8-oxo-dGTP pyrophosphatase MutT, NUDIX family [Candidatus Kentron sp. SD]VFK80225.1 MAG: 8-oxo-dGTP pyrophosphatase MutT, NUDIX family [Candidatus Kentron sp. SD]
MLIDFDAHQYLMPSDVSRHALRALRDRITRCVRKLDDLPLAGDVQQRPLVGDFDLAPARKTVPNALLTPAAVLVPIVQRTSGLYVLLTKRTSHLHDHPGQISFPGGRTEKIDDGPVATALRETREEISLEPSFIQVIGFLDTYETTTRYLVTPVVGLITPGFRLNPDPFEVAEIFEMPLAFLLNPANHKIQTRLIGEKRYGFYVLEYENHCIWGATAGMLMNLYRRIMGESHNPA